MIILPSVLASPLGERIGWTLVHSVWQVAIVAAGFAVLSIAMRRRSASARYVLGCLALAAMVAAPVATFFTLPLEPMQPAMLTPPAYFDTTPAATIEPLSTADAVSVPSTPKSPHNGTAPRIELPPAVAEVDGFDWNIDVGTITISLRQRLDPLLPWLSAGWLAGVALLAMRPLAGLFNVRRLKRRGLTPLSTELRQLAGRLMTELQIHQAVQFAESALVQVPTVVGYLRPMVLLPASVVTGLSSEQLELILAHELAHVRRHDYLVNLLQTAIEALLFYHPAMWWVSSQVRRERENCCDDLAVARNGNRRTLVQALCVIEQHRQAMTPALAASGGSLVDRARRLLVGPPAASAVDRATAWLAGLIALAVVAAILSFGRSYANEAATNSIDENLEADVEEGITGVLVVEVEDNGVALGEEVGVGVDTNVDETDRAYSLPAADNQRQLINELRAKGAQVELRDLGRRASGGLYETEPVVTAVHLRDAVATDDYLFKLKAFPHLRMLTLFGVTSITDRGLAVLLDLPHLENFQLQSDRVTDAGLAPLVRAEKLQFVALQGRGITDDALAHLAKLDQLTFISLLHTSVTGSGLHYLADLPKLDDLRVVGKKFDEENLAQLKDWPLRFLSVGTNTTDAGLDHVANVNTLEGLWVYSDNVTDAGVRQLASLNKLTQLHLSGGNVTDANLKFLADRPRFKAIGLNNTNVNGSFLRYLADSDVTSLSLMDTRLNQANLSYLLALPKLEHLSVGNHPRGDAQFDLTDACVSLLLQLKNLKSLAIRSNRLTKNAEQELRDAFPGISLHVFRPNGRVEAKSEPAEVDGKTESQTIEPLRPAELPPLPTLDSLADKSLLMQQIDEAFDEIEQRKEGHVIVGRVVVEGDDDPTLVTAQMEILGGGYFAGVTRDLQRPVGFAMHGYAPYLLQLSGRKGRIVDVGTIELNRLPPEKLLPVAGAVELEDGGDLSTVDVKFSIENPSINTPSGGTSPRPRWPKPIKVDLDSGGWFYQTGFSPEEYDVFISASGYVAQRREVTFTSGGLANLGTIRLERPRRVEIDYIVTRDWPFELDDVQQIVLTGGSRWQITPHRYRYDLEFKQAKGQLSFAWSYGPIHLADLGKGKLGDFLRVGGGAAQAPPNQVGLVDGHVYLLRRPDWENGGEDLVLFKVRTDAAPSTASPAAVPIRQTPLPAANPPTSAAEIDRLDREGFSKLHRAASGGHVDRVVELLARGANVNVEHATYRGTPLQYAAFRGHGETVQALLDHGAKVDARDANRRTPLIWAATDGHSDVISRLLTAGADINATNAGGWTPLHFAVDKGHTQAAQLLIDRGADIRATNSQGKTPVDLNPNLDLRIPWRALERPSESSGKAPLESSDSSSTARDENTTRAAAAEDEPAESEWKSSHDPDDVVAEVRGEPIEWRDIAPTETWFRQRAEYRRKNGHTHGYEAPDDYAVNRLNQMIWGAVLEKYKQDHDVEPTEEELNEFMRRHKLAEAQRRLETMSRLSNLRRELQDLPAGDSMDERRAQLERRIEALKKTVEEPSADFDRRFAEWYVGRWKLQQSLYKKYGGRAIWQQVGPEAIDAMGDLLKEKKAAGLFEIHDEPLRKQFWEPFVREKPGVLIPNPDRVFEHPWLSPETSRGPQ